ncbi:MAG: AEC family transporter [Lachnospira sp.]
MELALITAQQVAILFILIFAGFVCVKTRVIKPESKKVLSDLLLYLIVPAMIINSYASGYDDEIAANLGKTFLLGTVCLSIGIIISFIMTIWIKSKDKAIIRFACGFSNAAYMGFPLIEALFGAEGLIYASAFVTMFNVFLWTVGFIWTSGETNFKKIFKTLITTPAVIALVIGLIIFFARIPMPAVISKPMAYVGNMNTPISMIITGIIIAGSKFKNLVSNKWIWYVIIVRMFMVPLVCFSLFKILGLSGIVVNVCLILEACPTAAITSVFAVQYKHDENLAAGAVVITTFLSIITLPLCALLLTTVM